MADVDTNQFKWNSEILNRVQLFAGLRNNWQALEALARIMEVKSFSGGYTLIHEGEVGEELYILIEGQVSVVKKTQEGDPYKVAIFNHETTPALGEGGLIESDTRSAAVICDKDCRFLVLTRGQFEKFSGQYPEWAVPILKAVAGTLMKRLRHTSHDLMLLHKALMNEIRG